MAAGAGGEGLFTALRNLVATVVAILRTRLELLGTEIQEEKVRLLGALVSGLAALFLLGLGVILAIACLAAAFWEQRVVIFGGSAAILLAVAVFLVFKAKSLVTRSTNLFQASVEELKADLVRLRQEIRSRQQ